MLLLVMQGPYVQGLVGGTSHSGPVLPVPEATGLGVILPFLDPIPGAGDVEGDEQEALCWEWWDRRVHHGPVPVPSALGLLLSAHGAS